MNKSDCNLPIPLILLLTVQNINNIMLAALFSPQSVSNEPGAMPICGYFNRIDQLKEHYLLFGG